jgi:hypothetical protein
MNKPADQKVYDAVVAKVKAAVQKWPSAYASGMVVKEYKRVMAERGRAPYLEKKKSDKSEKGDDARPLARWYKEKWVDIATGKPCGAVRGLGAAGYYPTCRPSVRVSENTPVTVGELTAAQRRRAIAAKQVLRERHVDFLALAAGR